MPTPSFMLETIEVIPNELWIYRRPDAGKVYQLKSKLPGRPAVRMSTKERDPDKARFAAITNHREFIHRLIGNLPLKQVHFHTAVNYWIEALRERHLALGKPSRHWLRTAESVAKNSFCVFEDFNKPLDRITDRDISQWQLWTAKNHHQSSLGYRTSFLRNVFKTAIQKGLMAPSRLPHISSPKLERNFRSAFSHEEWEYLDNFMDSWWQTPRCGWHRDYRWSLTMYVRFLAYSGLRLGALRYLKWRDIEIRDYGRDSHTAVHDVKTISDLAHHMRETGKYCLIKVGASRSKTRRRKIVVARSEIIPLIEFILKMRDLWTDREDYIFAHPSSGEPIKYPHSAFYRLLKDANLKNDSEGKNFTLYSLRHTYATHQLTRGVSIYSLAENMLTSVRMIEEHYGHVATESMMDELA